MPPIFPDSPRDLLDEVTGALAEGFKNPFPTKTPKNPVDKTADLLVKDEKVKLSDLLAKHGWGAASSKSNRTARGVIQCESGGDPKAYNDQPCGGSDHAVGLMQICTIHAGTKGIPKTNAREWLEDPANNVKAGREVWRSQGWAAWACPKVETNWDPEITVKKGSAYGAIADVVDPMVAPFERVAEFFGFLTQASTWLRIGKVIIGAVLLGVGVVALVTVAIKEVGAPAAKAVAKVTPVGKAAKVAKVVT